MTEEECAETYRRHKNRNENEDLRIANIFLALFGLLYMLGFLLLICAGPWIILAALSKIFRG